MSAPMPMAAMPMPPAIAGIIMGSVRPPGMTPAACRFPTANSAGRAGTPAAPHPIPATSASGCKTAGQVAYVLIGHPVPTTHQVRGGLVPEHALGKIAAREPVERALQDEYRGVLIDDLGAPRAGCVGGDQFALDCRGR